MNAPRQITIALVLGLALPLVSCGSDSARSSPPLREAVLRGAARDFAQGTGIGGKAFEACVLERLRRALDRPTLARLVQVYRRPGGQPFAAQALNQLAAPLAARCGQRTYVPELVEASRGLRGASAAGAGAKRLGATYGPYLGVRCRRANHVGCDRVGIDVVLAAPARSVTAVVGHRRLRLRTPGLHSGARYRDWVGPSSALACSGRAAPSTSTGTAPRTRSGRAVPPSTCRSACRSRSATAAAPARSSGPSS